MEDLLWLWITLGVLLIIGLVLAIGYIVILNSFKKVHIQSKTIMQDIHNLILEKYQIMNRTIELTKRELADDAKVIAQMQEIPQVALDDTTERKQTIVNEISLSMQVLLEKINTVDKLKSLKSVHEQKELWIVAEESLSFARLKYNEKVSTYNHRITTFPTRLVASIKKIKPLKFFEPESIDFKQHITSN